MIFTLVWLLGSLAALAFWGYMKGRADARFRDNRGITENPPYVIGMLTSPFWPAQVIAGLIWMICHVSVAKGKGDGLAVDQELSVLRKFASDYKREEARTYAMLTSMGADIGSIDDQTKRALLARSIEWGMEDEAKVRRETAAVAVRKPKPEPVYDDTMFDILDKAGVKVESPAYDRYRDRTKGELDL